MVSSLDQSQNNKGTIQFCMRDESEDQKSERPLKTLLKYASSLHFEDAV